MALVITHLQRAADSLARALEQPLNEFTRDAAIQRFEYTFELSWKMIRRCLVQELGFSESPGMTRRELFRLAADQKLIQDPEAWFQFQEDRNRTAHMYSENIAKQVHATATQFLPEARFLLKALESYV
jgi:nucleotidyltransferase substrate binding protein (TIGR01987 family)